MGKNMDFDHLFEGVDWEYAWNLVNDEDDKKKEEEKSVKEFSDTIPFDQVGHAKGNGGPIQLFAELDGKRIPYGGFDSVDEVDQFMSDRDDEMEESDFRNWPEDADAIMVKDGEEFIQRHSGADWEKL